MILGQYLDSLPASNLFGLTPNQQRFDVDLRHIAIRLEGGWIIYQRRPDGWLHAIDRWDGPRRSIFQHCEDMGIDISREAEAAIDSLSERTKFRDIEPGS